MSPKVSRHARRNDTRGKAGLLLRIRICGGLIPRKPSLSIMSHNDGWMNGWNTSNGWAGGGMWIWTAIGILMIVLLIVAIIKLSKK